MATSKGGITIDLKSKVEKLYGNAIRTQINAILKYYEINNAAVTLDDRGAVPFVIAARVETAIKRSNPLQKGDFQLRNVRYIDSGKRDRIRRTRLYLPGNEPHFFLNAGLHKPDCIILDLEDSVIPAEKDAARILVRNALRNVDFGSAERMVRINPFPLGREDLKQIVPGNVQTILIPKCESSKQIYDVDAEIDTILSKHKIKRNLFLIPIIESALGIERAFEIASASRWNCALAIGLEDYTADIGVVRTKVGTESLFARCAIVNGAKAAGIQALDSVFSDVNDDEGLRQSVEEAKGLGFDGKGCIHPRQIKIIHRAFAPSSTDVEYARRVIDAYNEAQKTGSGVVALDSKMIDAPVVKRAQHIITLAQLNSEK
jgi:citrate lyase subunit beta/citryl-CoA lyase